MPSRPGGVEATLDGVVCAWCGALIRGSPTGPRISHGMCVRCMGDEGFLPVESVHGMAADEADALPFGLLRLDHEGRVRQYNYPESIRSGFDPQDVIGRDFFDDVAPCTGVREFRGRFRQMVANGVPAREEFDFVFRLERGDLVVHLAMVHAPGAGTVILVEDVKE